MTTAVLYTRVSTDDQAETGLGLDDQLARLQQLAAMHEWDTIELVDDGRSGRTLQRPAITEALDLLATGQADVLAVSKLDRLSRSTVDFGNLLTKAKDEGWALVALDPGVDTTTASGKLVATVLMAVAEWEAEVIGERTKAALARKKANGDRLGRPVIVPQPLREEIHRRHTVNDESIRSIARTLNERGEPTPGGGIWYPSSVSSIVRSVELDIEAQQAKEAS